jgi:hypothetical protein
VLEEIRLGGATSLEKKEGVLWFTDQYIDP